LADKIFKAERGKGEQDLVNLAGQGWLQLGELTLAFVLSALVGAEREIRQKSAGLRTHTLVGVSAALFMLISKYGFMNILSYGQVVLDPSRVAAQVVSGIGFIGGGVVFMRRDVVRGLTTAASIWFTAALGMACGAGLPILALATTVGHFVIMLVFPKLAEALPRSGKLATEIHISYAAGRGLLRNILIGCSELRFGIDRVQLDQEDSFTADLEEVSDLADDERREQRNVPKGFVSLRMLVKGKRPVSHLIARLSEIDGVQDVGLSSDEHDHD
jgi:putative Mg2+ transporter-C (MgtC) family protein